MDVAPAWLLNVLAAPAPREPGVVQRIAGVLGTQRAYVARLIGNKAVPRRVLGGVKSLFLLSLFVFNPIVGAPTLLLTLSVDAKRQMEDRAWNRRVARDGVLVECVAVHEPEARQRWSLTYEAGGEWSTAWCTTSRAVHEPGPAWVLILPGERRQWVHVIGPRGVELWKVGGIRVPAAKLLDG